MEKAFFLQGKYSRLYKLIGVTAGVFLAFRYALPLFAPFVAAYLLAAVVRPVVLFLHRRLHIPLSIGGVAVLLLLLGFLGMGLFFLGKLLVEQVVLLLQNYTGYRDSFLLAAEKLCSSADGWFCLKQGTMEGVLQTGLESLGKTVHEELLPNMSRQSFLLARKIAFVAAGCVIAFVAALLLLSDREKYVGSLRKSGFYTEMKGVIGKLSDAGVAYLKTQCILIFLIALICSVGFLFVKREYALLLGLGVAVLDAFPVLGSGLVLVPWAVVSLLKESYLQVAVLVVMYLFCLAVREGLEPKLLGNRIGIPPLYTLMAVYVGVELFGILGVILGPFGLVIIRSVLEETKDCEAKEKGFEV